jgi:hypothetical protein
MSLATHDADMHFINSVNWGLNPNIDMKPNVQSCVKRMELVDSVSENKREMHGGNVVG